MFMQAVKTINREPKWARSGLSRQALTGVWELIFLIFLLEGCPTVGAVTGPWLCGPLGGPPCAVCVPFHLL